MTEFCRKVLSVVRRIPCGETLSYNEVALRVGRPRAYRAVGSILKRNVDPMIPCYRVICSDGSIGGYNRGKVLKRLLLRSEGVSF